MEANVLCGSFLCSNPSPSFLLAPFTVKISRDPNSRYYPVSIRARAGPPSSTSSTSNNNSSNDGDILQPPPLTITPPDTVEIRFRRGSRKKSKKQKEDTANGGLPAPPPPKDWESMTITEKAIELYMGEKGLLFWLNKFAYASIFITIGVWILFRFVGPSFGFYQLDSPTLSPTNMVK